MMIKAPPVFSFALSILYCCLASAFLFPASTGSAEDHVERKRLVLGVRADAPPFSTKTENGYRGYTVSLCRQIAERAEDMGLSCGFDFQEVSAQNRFTKLDEGKIDMLCGASTVTLERMRVADFSLFTFLSGASVMYKNTSAQQTSGGERVINVGVLDGTTTKEEVRRIFGRFSSRQENQDLHAELKVEVVDTISDHYTGLELLLNDKLDAYMADREILLALMHHAEDKRQYLEVSPDYFTVEPYAIGLNRNNPDLRYVANLVLTELFAWEGPSKTGQDIFHVLRQNFHVRRFSRSLEDLFRFQRLTVGKSMGKPMQKVDCSNEGR